MVQLELPAAAEAVGWEDAKENAQPLRQGRNKRALEMVHEAAKPSEDTLTTQREQFEASLASNEDDADPLAAWCAYIKWTQEAYAAGGKTSQLLPLLERCAHCFKDDPRYDDDVRYLRVWILYADQVRDAEQIFDYLHDRRIGQRHAVFWESWAAVLEAKQQFNAADEAYTRGLRVNAEPIGRLRRNHEQFQLRLVRRIQRGQADAAPIGGTPAVEAAASAPPRDRKALNRLTKKEAGGSKRPTSHRPACPLRSTTAASSRKPAGTIGGNFMVYEDNVAHAPGGSDDARASWETGTVRENSKENKGDATTWAGVTLPQRKEASVAARGAQPACPFHVFDEDPTADEAKPDTPAKMPNVRLALDGPSAADTKRLQHLIERPLERFTTARADAPAASEAGEARDAQNRSDAQGGSGGGVGARAGAPSNALLSRCHVPTASAPSGLLSRSELSTGYDSTLLSFGGEESSFEEARARAHRARGDSVSDNGRASAKDAQAAASSAVQVPAGRKAAPLQPVTLSQESAPAVATSTPLSTQLQAMPTSVCSQASATTAATTPASAPKQTTMQLKPAADDPELGAFNDEGVTINTKAALQALMPSFSADIEGDGEDEGTGAPDVQDAPASALSIRCQTEAAEHALAPAAATLRDQAAEPQAAAVSAPAASRQRQPLGVAAEAACCGGTAQGRQASPLGGFATESAGTLKPQAEASVRRDRRAWEAASSPQLEPTVNTKAALAALMPNFNGLMSDDEADDEPLEAVGGLSSDADGVSGSVPDNKRRFSEAPTAPAEPMAAASTPMGGTSFAVFEDTPALKPKAAKATGGTSFAVFEDTPKPKAAPAERKPTVGAGFENSPAPRAKKATPKPLGSTPFAVLSDTPKPKPLGGAPFAVLEDTPAPKPKPAAPKPTCGTPFALFEDTPKPKPKGAERKPTGGTPFAVFEDTPKPKATASTHMEGGAFAVFEDASSPKPKAASPKPSGAAPFAVLEDTPAPKTAAVPSMRGCTFAVFEDSAPKSTAPVLKPTDSGASHALEEAPTQRPPTAAPSPKDVAPFAVFDDASAPESMGSTTVGVVEDAPVASSQPKVVRPTPKPDAPFEVFEDLPPSKPKAPAPTQAPASGFAVCEDPQAAAEQPAAPATAVSSAAAEDATPALTMVHAAPSTRVERSTLPRDSAGFLTEAVVDGSQSASSTLMLDAGMDVDSDVNPATFRGILRFLSKPDHSHASSNGRQDLGVDVAVDSLNDAGVDGGANPPVDTASSGQSEVHIVDPFDALHQHELLTKLLPELRARDGYRDHPVETAPPKTLQKGTELTIGGNTWQVGALLGAGAFGKVFAVARTDAAAPSAPMALKVSYPPNLWEWHILTQLSDRLPASPWAAAHASLRIDVFGAPSSADGSCARGSCAALLQPLVEGITLQALVNEHRLRGTVPDELIPMLFTAKLLRAAQALHEAGVIHADIKPDNVMIRCNDASALECSESLRDGGWDAAFGVELVDFGRAIDLRGYEPRTVFESRRMADAFECVEMREGRPWTLQADSFGVCACAHFLLHAQYMELVCQRGVWAPRAALKRYWQLELWSGAFDTLLNVPRDGLQPNLSHLADGFEGHLDESVARRQKLRQALQTQYALLKEKGLFK